MWVFFSDKVELNGEIERTLETLMDKGTTQSSTDPESLVWYRRATDKSMNTSQ